MDISISIKETSSILMPMIMVMFSMFPIHCRTFYQRKISLSDRIITFSGTFSGETLQIVPLNSEHGFQTGDAVVYNGTSTTTTTTDFEGNVIAVDTTTETLDGLTNGIVYYVYRVDNNSIKLSVDRDQLFNSNYVSVSGTAT